MAPRQQRRVLSSRIAADSTDTIVQPQLFPDLCHDIGCLALRAIKTFFDGCIGLLFQNLDIELGGAARSEQPAKQESDRDFAACVGFPHDVLAGKLFDHTIGCRGVCRDGRRPAECENWNGCGAGPCQSGLDLPSATGSRPVRKRRSSRLPRRVFLDLRANSLMQINGFSLAAVEPPVPLTSEPHEVNAGLCVPAISVR
jgi:hypothetical protein